jgi:hypothetical protein
MGRLFITWSKTDGVGLTSPVGLTRVWVSGRLHPAMITVSWKIQEPISTPWREMLFYRAIASHENYILAVSRLCNMFHYPTDS